MKKILVWSEHNECATADALVEKEMKSFLDDPFRDTLKISTELQFSAFRTLLLEGEYSFDQVKIVIEGKDHVFPANRQFDSLWPKQLSVSEDLLSRRLWARSRSVPRGEPNVVHGSTRPASY